jgi:UDP-GlcNAc:undecaprenyl-phosphate GlcNAc-1-phosphate transferase
MSLDGLLPYLLFALLFGGLAAAIAWAMARWAVLVDVPNARSSHVRPTPRGGGLGIFVAFAAGLLVLAAGSEAPMLELPAFIGFAAGAAIMGMAGLADDIRTMSFATKLATSWAASALAIAAGIVITVIYIPGIGPVELGAFGYVLTLLWLVGLTNAFNFMDGLDGLAGGTAVIAAAFLCVVAVLLGEPAVAMLALLLAGTSAGFLALNFPPARIFMGDVGSQFLGFAFAALGVLLAQADTTGTIVLVVPLLLFHFLFDTGFTALRRWKRGENLAAAHRSHLYQLLNRSGLSHRQVAAGHYLMAIVHGLVALWFIGAAPSQRWLVFLVLFAGQAAYAAVSLRLYSAKNNSVTP